MTARLASLGTAFWCALTVGLHGAPSPRELTDRASADFRAGRIAESVEGFDQLVRLDPTVEPYLWQRGIALYHAGRYDDCRRQFERHRAVNRDDVEDAAWRFLCMARAESPEVARTRLLPVGPDERRPMREIYPGWARLRTGGRPMTDEELIRAFETGQMPEGGFHHPQHVRVAWHYLRRHGLPTALARFCDGLKAFARAQGADGLYHETITVAFVLLINERMARTDPGASWDAFAAAHPDLLTWKPSLLDRYYKKATLESAHARRVFVMPDLADSSDADDVRNTEGYASRRIPTGGAGI